MTAFLSHTVQQITSFDTSPLLLTRLSLRVRDDFQAEHSPISLTAWETLSQFMGRWPFPSYGLPEPLTCAASLYPGASQDNTTGQGRRDSKLLVTGHLPRNGSLKWSFSLRFHGSFSSRFHGRVRGRDWVYFVSWNPKILLLARSVQRIFSVL